MKITYKDLEFDTLTFRLKKRSTEKLTLTVRRMACQEMNSSTNILLQKRSTISPKTAMAGFMPMPVLMTAIATTLPRSMMVG